MIPLLWLSLLQVEFDVEPASFRVSDSLAQVVVYYSIPYNQLSYEVRGDSLLAGFGLEIEVGGPAGEVLLTDRLERRAVIPSLQEAQRRDLKLLDGFDFLARPGRYRLRLVLHTGDERGEQVAELSVPPFSGAPLLSDLLLCSAIGPDTARSVFTRFGRRLTPNPGAKFGRAYDLIYVYTEVYNLLPDSGFYELDYTIEDDLGRVVRRFPEEVRVKPGANLSKAFGLSARGLKPGRYRLKVEVRDRSTGGSVIQERDFHIEALERAPAPSPEPEYYRAIELIATPAEWRLYQSLSEEGKEEFLRRFWQSRDYREFEARARYADENFGFGGTPGRVTDRGRIYIRYGPPSQVERYPVEGGMKPQEHWFYYSEGYRFIFVDLFGTGDYELIYSNLPAEPKDPNWRRYVHPSLLPELE